MPETILEDTDASPASTPSLSPSPRLFTKVRVAVFAAMIAVPLSAICIGNQFPTNAHEPAKPVPAKKIRQSPPSFSETTEQQDLLQQTFLVPPDEEGEPDLNVRFDDNLGIRINGTLYRGDAIECFTREVFQKTTGIPAFSNVHHEQGVVMEMENTIVKVTDEEFLALVRKLHKAASNEEGAIEPQEIAATMTTTNWTLKAMQMGFPPKLKVTFTRVPTPHRENVAVAKSN